LLGEEGCDCRPGGSAGMNQRLVTVLPEFEVGQLGPEGATTEV
jgi:hypothetical protein